MAVDLVAGIEVIWGLNDHRWLYIVRRTERAGNALVTVMVDDLDDRVVQIAARGIEPTTEELYEGGTRKVLYHDPKGNQIGFGGAPTGE